jgi:hypothetical protein
MSEETKYIKLRTKNAKMMQLYGDKLTFSEAMRVMRTNGLHTELEFSDRYGDISFSSTLSGGCNGARFKMIGYSHPYRWSTVYIPVTAEQEAVLFKKGCEMAGLDNSMRRQMIEIALGLRGCVNPFEAIVSGCEHLYKDNSCFFGPNHIQYDKGAAFFSFISKRNIWKPSKTKMICNRAVAEVMLEVWPEMLDIKYVAVDGICTDVWMEKIKADPAQITPDQLHYMVNYYFNREAA